MCQDCDVALFCMNILNPAALGQYIAHNFREVSPGHVLRVS